MEKAQYTANVAAIQEAKTASSTLSEKIQDELQHRKLVNIPAADTQ